MPDFALHHHRRWLSHYLMPLTQISDEFCILNCHYPNYFPFKAGITLGYISNNDYYKVNMGLNKVH